MWNKIFQSVFIFCLALSASAQELKFYTPPGDISQNSIAAISQDNNGFLWFGTRYGANRYNGVEYKNILADGGDEFGLKSNSVACFLNDGDRNIWMGTMGGGISIFNIDLQRFVPKYNKALESINQSQVIAIHKDREGNFWIGTAKEGIKLLKKDADHLIHFFSNSADGDGIPTNNITGITEDHNGNILFSTWGGGLCFYNPEKKIFRTFKHKNTPLIPEDNVVRSLYKGKSGIVWLATHQGILKLESNSAGNPVFSKLKFENPIIEELFENTVIPCMLEDSQSRLWIGTENKGLVLYDIKNKVASKFHYREKGKYTIDGNSIWSLFEDRHGTVWIGTYKHGIRKVDPREQKFQYVSASYDSKFHISYGLVSSFAEDNEGNLWVGTDGGGLNFIERDAERNIQRIAHPPFQGLDSDVIISMLNDKRGRLWVGTWGKGLYVKEKNDNRFKRISNKTINPDNWATNDIMNLFEAESGNIWICRYRGGLILYVPEEDKFYDFEPSVNANSISSEKMISVVEDKDGVIWAGSGDSGVDRFRLNEKNEIVDLKNFPFTKRNRKDCGGSAIDFLYVDSRNTFWVGTEGEGLKKYNSHSEEFENITEKDGLPSNIIYGILDDGEKLWVSTGSGLASISLDDFEIQSFDVSDGLLSNEFARKSCYKSRDGTMFFGGINGLNYFDPKNISVNSVIPDVFISEVSLRQNDQEKGLQNDLNRQLSLGAVELKADQNDVDFEFAALNYTQSGKNTYSYILENYDKEWKTVQNITRVSYTNIPSGKYVFKVKASNNDGVWNPKPAEVRMTIFFPWHRTSLAYLAYFLLLSGVLTAVYYNIINRERLKNQLELEHLERTKMEELNEVKSRFFANISHEFKTPLTLIISPLKAIQRKLEKVENKNQVNLMLRNAERLLILINQILALSKLESGTEKLKASKLDIVEFCRNITNNFHNYAEDQFITFEVEIPDEPIELYFEKDKIEKVLINLISNAFKFTPEFGRINFALEKKENQVKLSVSDTGIGISGEQLEHVFERFYRAGSSKTGDRSAGGTGIGLSLSKQLVEIHKGTIRVKSTEGQGTIFDVFLPLGKAHLDESQIIELAPQHNLSEDSKIELRDFNVKTVQETNNEATDSNVPVVLIAEDNPDLRAFTRTYLQTNYQIIEAENGLQAYQLAKKHIPDIVITDWMMPEMTGFELAKKLRRDEKTSHVFILMVTVKSSEESKEEGFEAGVDYYITKPFNPKLLDLRIQNVLKTRKKYKTQILKNSITLTNEPKVVKISNRDEEFLNKVVAIIDENIGNSKLNIDYICKKIGFSKSQLYRKMKGVVGQSANEFIRSIRLKRAAELLQIGDLTISEVTYKVGFNDLQYFRDCFKNQYEMTPSDYIQKVKARVE